MTAPTLERLKKSRLSLSTVKFSARRPWASPVWMFMAPMLERPWRPENRAPPRMGTISPPLDRPMRLVKTRSATLGMPNWNILWPSRKNCRFSGKKSENRVRLIC